MAQSQRIGEYLTIDSARALAVDILGRHGFTVEEANTIADHLIEAELVGQSMMGLMRLRLITRLASQGRGEITTLGDGPTYVHIDGAGNPAQLSVTKALAIALEKAQASAIAMAGVINSSLSGMLASYLRPIAAEGFVGILLISSYGRVAPFGGVEPILGTNPFGFGFPGPSGPIIVDLATSQVSNGTVELAAVRGEPIPEGSALDEEGNLTTDPAEAMAGALLPMGGHKGYSLGFALQVLGLMVGGDPVPRGLGNQGILALVIDPSVFGPSDELAVRMAALVARIKGSVTAPGVDEILIPGERSERNRRASLQSGIFVPADVLSVLRSL